MKINLKNKTFLVSLASAVLLILQQIFGLFGITIDQDVYLSIVNSVLGLLVVLGIVNNPTKSTAQTDEVKTETAKPVDDNEN